MADPKKSGMPTLAWVLLGCGAVAVVGGALVVAAGMWLLSGPTGGVKLGNEMDQYALDYLAEHGILEEGEAILAYYDATVSMDGSEAAILTDERVIYHKDGNNTSIPLDEIDAVRHRREGLIGDVIEIESLTGLTMKIEIAPLNQGQTFKNVLMTVWKRARSAREADGGS